MKRLLTLLLCAVLATGSLHIAAAAAENDTADTAASAITFDDTDGELAGTGATADEAATAAAKLLTEAQFQSKISEMRIKYPHGSIWEGYYYENGSVMASTCWAYSAQMLREFFGVNFYADGMLKNKYYDADGIYAGDWVRINGDSHSIFITKVNEKGVYYTDGNGTGVYNQVRWDGFYSWETMRNIFSYRLHVPGNTLMGNGDEIQHTIVYNANGGTGSVASQTLRTGDSFKVKDNAFSRAGYTFAGYTVKRSADNKWFTSGGTRWQVQSDIYDNDYSYAIYQPGDPGDGTYYMSKNWLDNISSPTTFTFYAQWVPDEAVVEFADNYSGYNYMLGSDLDEDYAAYLYARDTDNYTVSVDAAVRLNHTGSLKIVAEQPGSSKSDLAFVTSTNKGYGNGYSQAGIVGDDKDLTLRFYARADVEDAKMYLRWGYSSKYVSVTLTKGWKEYVVSMPKTRYYSTAIHPYFDKAGTYHINSMVLGDSADTSNVTPETGRWTCGSKTVKRGGAVGTMPTPVREGYIFLGWYTAAEGGTRMTNDTKVNETTLRLYAHWRKNISYTPVKTVKYNGHIYELYDNTLTWDDASLFCTVRGGHLLTIDSAEENQAAQKMLNDVQSFCWLGLSHTGKTDTWQWVDGSALTYSNWYGKASSQGNYAFMYPINYDAKSCSSKWDRCETDSNISSYYSYFNSLFICEYDSPVFRGDFDGNGEVDITDATMIQRCTAKVTVSAVSDEVMTRGDINANGRLDIIDVTFIQRYIAKLETPYAVGDWIKS